MTRKAAVLLTWALVSASGCANYTTPVAPQRTLSPAERNFQAVWDSSLEVLREYDFTVNRRDPRGGIITTMPLVGKGALEFWRKDAATFGDLTENSIQKIYRIATVTVVAEPNRPDRYRAGVRIDVARSDMPDMQVTNTSEAYNLVAPPGGRSSWVMQLKDEAEPNNIKEPPAGYNAAQPKPPAPPASGPGAATRSALAKGQLYPLPSGQVYLGRDTALEIRIGSEINSAAFAVRVGAK